MRLIDTETGQFVDKGPEHTVYAILSHTWDEGGEQTYEELKKIQLRYRLRAHVPQSRSGDPLQPSTSWMAHSIELPLKMLRHALWRDRKLSPKIRHACAIARKNGYRYIWIDSCCIDKSSSSELSEAVNSMYKWYSLADVCYAYLADVPLRDDHHAEDSRFCKSRWFTRGWTLQELIAPINVEFLSMDWTPIGSKHTLDTLVERITAVSRRALLHVEPLSSFSVAQRLSWAADRITTREEDRAYSLLGIFAIHMPTLYGEGSHAFQRLQEQIMQRLPDQSLFAWGDVYLPTLPQLLTKQIPIRSSITLKAVKYGSDRSQSANTPYDFRKSKNIRNIQLPASLHHEIGYTSTPYGIRTQFQMISLTSDFLSRILPLHEVELQLPDNSNRWYLAILGCEDTERPGHLLGRVCYIPQSKSGVEFVYAGFIDFGLTAPDLFSLSPAAVEHFLPHLELKTVYVPHPDPADQLQSIQYKAHNAIKLVLLTETSDALHSRGYRADLRNPDPDHPHTHRLTLSNAEHAIVIAFRHAFEDDGKQLTIEVEVKTSESRGQPDSAPASIRADRPMHTVSWMDFAPWKTGLGPKLIRLRGAGGEMLIVNLGLDFVGLGFYFVRVDVRSDAPPAPRTST